MGMGMGHRHGPMAGADPSVMVESRLADMKTLLQITAAQESAWQAFTAAARQQAAGMQAMRAQMQQDAGTAPERMAQRSAMMQQRSAAMATMSTAFGALYVVVGSSEQIRHNVLDVFADIASFREAGCICHREGHVQEAS